MDYIKDVEERLMKYKNADETINNLNKRLDKVKMRGCPKDVTAVDLTKVGHGSSCNTEAMNDLLEVQHIIKQINKVEIEKEMIDDTLKILKDDNLEDYEFINYKYLEDLTMEQVSQMLGYSTKSSRTIYSIKDRALKKFAFYYWGN